MRSRFRCGTLVLMTKVLITGASGQLGSYLVREARRAGLTVAPWSGRKDVDLADAAAVRAAFQRESPDVVIHAAALSSIKESLENPELARRVNVDATEILAKEARYARARFVYTSTDMVYCGDRSPYAESARALPATKYGQSKLHGERVALNGHPEAAILRLSLMIGLAPATRATFFSDQIQALRAGRQCKAFVDEFRSVMTYDAAARCIVEVAQSKFFGLLNVAGPERVSRFDAMRVAAGALGLDADLVVPIPQVSVVGPEPRPRDLTLDVSLLHAHFAASAPKALSAACALEL